MDPQREAQPGRPPSPMKRGVSGTASPRKRPSGIAVDVRAGVISVHTRSPSSRSPGRSPAPSVDGASVRSQSPGPSPGPSPTRSPSRSFTGLPPLLAGAAPPQSSPRRAGTGLGSTYSQHARHASFGRGITRGQPQFWVFVVNGAKWKAWKDDRTGTRLLGQLSSVRAEVRVTGHRGHAAELAEAAARGGAHLVIAVGGDGTLNEVVDGVMRAGVVGADGVPVAAVATLPLGTAHDFHRTMHWRAGGVYDFDAAVQRLGSGSVALVDVGRLECQDPNGGTVVRHFINVASAGASAEAARRVKTWRWLGRRLVHRVAGALGMAAQEPFPMAVQVDGCGWVRVPETQLVAVGNGRYALGGLKLTPGADPFDPAGRLQMVTGAGVGLYDYVTQQGQWRAGRHVELPGFLASKGRRVQVVPLVDISQDPETWTPEWLRYQRVRVEADGEFVGFAPFVAEKLPKALKIVV